MESELRPSRLGRRLDVEYLALLADLEVLVMSIGYRKSDDAFVQFVKVDDDGFRPLVFLLVLPAVFLLVLGLVFFLFSTLFFIALLGQGIGRLFL